MIITSPVYNQTNCRWCGMIHGAQCPAVKAMEFYENGTIKRVEFAQQASPLPITTAANVKVTGDYVQSVFITETDAQTH